MKRAKQNPIKLLLHWAGSDKYYLYLSVFLSLISGLCSVVPYYGIYQIISAVYDGSASRLLISQYCIFIAIGIAVRTIIFACSGVVSHKGAYQALFKVRCMVTEHIAKVPLGSLSERSTGQIKTVLNEDIEKLELFLAHNLPELIYFLSGPIAIFIYLLSVNVPMALVSLIPLFLAAIVMGIIFKGMSGIMGEAGASVSGLNAVLIEYISGMKQIKAYNMTSSSFKRYSDAIEKENTVWNTISRRMGPPYAAFVLLIECGMMLMIPIGGFLFTQGALSGAAFLLFAFVGSLYLTDIRPLQELGTKMAQVISGITKTQEILEIPIFKSEGVQFFPTKHDIELRNVQFAYDGKQDILKDCNLKIGSGEKLALVGCSGAGKSTIISLISRFYDVDRGEILIGGKNLRDISYESLLHNIAIVFQKTFLTRDSVFENIRMDCNATLEEVRNAAVKAQIDDFILSLPNGYDTKVGSFGSRFSGGEKQRIAIARAILKNAPILILDEATSAADPENQVEIDKAIAHLCEGKTVIIVAHRLSVVKMCDRVAVVEHQCVTCSGTHDEVLADNEYYRNAWSDYERARCISYRMEGDQKNDTK